MTDFWEGKMGISQLKRDPMERPAGRPLFCSLCRVSFQSETPGRCSPEIDRIHPGSYGGDYWRGNVQWLCRSCNAWKGDRLLSEDDIDQRRFWNHPCRLGCECEVG